MTERCRYSGLYPKCTEDETLSEYRIFFSTCEDKNLGFFYHILTDLMKKICYYCWMLFNQLKFRSKSTYL